MSRLENLSDLPYPPPVRGRTTESSIQRSAAALRGGGSYRRRAIENRRGLIGPRLPNLAVGVARIVKALIVVDNLTDSRWH
jgi:hypothetical protein